MKYDQEKLPAGEKEYYSYIHPKYPFIRSNRNPQMVEGLLQYHIFPNRTQADCICLTVCPDKSIELVAFPLWELVETT